QRPHRSGGPEVAARGAPDGGEVRVPVEERGGPGAGVALVAGEGGHHGREEAVVVPAIADLGALVGAPAPRAAVAAPDAGAGEAEREVDGVLQRLAIRGDHLDRRWLVGGG